MIRTATPDDLPQWLDLRAQLWPGTSAAEHRAEALSLMARPAGEVAVFLAGDPPVGFAELTVRRDHVNGCDSSPVAFLEGIYLRPEARGSGAGAALVARAADWARAQGLTELGSDALLDNHASHQFHRATGFEETERVVYFRRAL